MSSDSESSVERVRKLKKKARKKHRDYGDRDKKSRNKRYEKRSRSSRRRKHRKHYRRSSRKSCRDDSDSSSSSSASSSSSDYRTRRVEKKRRRAHKRRRKESKKESDESSIEGYKGKPRKVKRSRKIRHHNDDCNDQRSDQTKMISETKSIHEMKKEAQSDEKRGRKDNQPQKMKSNMKPMSKEEYEKLQSTISEVFDPLSGRYRLVRGTGEIIERIVSRSDHERINQIATRGDGTSFSKSIIDAATRRSK